MYPPKYESLLRKLFRPKTMMGMFHISKQQLAITDPYYVLTRCCSRMMTDVKIHKQANSNMLLLEGRTLKCICVC